MASGGSVRPGAVRRAASSANASSADLRAGAGVVLRRDRRPAAGDAFGAEHLDGLAGLVAGAPAEVGLVLDLVAQLQDPVHHGFRPRRAAGHVHVDRQELVGRHDRVVVEHAHRRRAGAHRDRPLRLEHLVVDAADDRRHLDRHAAGQDQEVGLARAGAHGLRADPGDVEAGTDERDHLDRAAGQAESGREDRVRARPRERGIERGREDAALDVLLELGLVHVAAQHPLRLVLADLEVVAGVGAGEQRGAL